METDSVSGTLFFLVFRIPDNCQSPETHTPSSEPFTFDMTILPQYFHIYSYSNYNLRIVQGSFIKQNPFTSMMWVLSYDVGFNPSTQRHYRRLIYYLYIYIYIHSYMFRSYDHHQAEKYITTLGLLN
jgi:hypothetical protein